MSSILQLRTSLMLTAERINDVNRYRDEHDNSFQTAPQSEKNGSLRKRLQSSPTNLARKLSDEMELHQVDLELRNTELLRIQNLLEYHQIELEAQNAELRRAQEELETQQVELELQNEELLRAKEELELSRNKYAELYDFAPVAYFTFDASGVIREVNLTGAQLLGIERRQLADKPFTGFIADADGRGIFSVTLKLFCKAGACRNVKSDSREKTAR